MHGNARVHSQGGLLRSDVSASLGRLTVARRVTLTPTGSAGRNGQLVSREESRKRVIESLGRAAIVCRSPLLAWAILPRRVELLIDIDKDERLDEFMVRLTRKWSKSLPRFSARLRVVRSSVDLIDEITRIHLFPFKAGVVSSLAALEDSPWSGHAVLMGLWEAEFQDVGRVLDMLGGGDAARDRLTHLMAVKLLAEEQEEGSYRAVGHLAV